MKQERLADEDFDPVYFYFKEIQAGGLNQWTLEENNAVRNILEVIKGLDEQTATHEIDSLEMDKNPQMFAENLIDTYPEHNDDFCVSLVNNFSNNMLTRAREKGKYVVLILLENSLVLCHTEADEKTVTKDAEIIERLLDTDNVDKYARFKQTDEDVEVLHFERHLSKSFSDWLGIPPEEVAYQEAGKIKVFTNIEDSTVRFEFEQEEFTQKFLIDEEYELVSGFLVTPQDKYPIRHLKIGQRQFDNVDEFLQEFYSLYYDFKNFKAQYETVAESITPHVTTVVDHQYKVTKGGPNGEIVVKKDRDDEFNILFADKTIELSAQWRRRLAKKFRQNDPINLHHIGTDFSEEPDQIGQFEFYNELNVDTERINELYTITQEARTGDTLSNIIYSVIFYTLSKWTTSPICHFFSQMSDFYESELSSEGMILRDEDGLMELKSRDWVAETDGSDAIAEKLTSEIQDDSKLILVGIDEYEQQIRPLSRNRFDSERNERIKKKVRKMNGDHESIEMSALPLSGEDCLLFVYSIRGEQELNLQMV